MTTEWMRSMLGIGWNKVTLTPFEKMVEHWDCVTDAWNTRATLDSAHLIAFVTILCEQIGSNTAAELNLCSEFFLENRIFETMALFATKSQSNDSIRLVVSLTTQIVEAFPASLLAHGAIHPALCKILDLGLSEKDELLKLIGALFRKLQSLPQVTSVFVVECSTSPDEKSAQYQLINLLATLYSIPKYKEEASKLVSSLLSIETDSSVDMVSGDSLCHAIVDDLVAIRKLLPDTLHSNTLGIGELLRLIEFCNNLTKGPTFVFLKKMFLDHLYKKFLVETFLSKLQDSDLNIVNAHVAYLTEIMDSLSSTMTPLRETFMRFIFSDIISDSAPYPVVDHLIHVFSENPKERVAVNLLRFFAVILELRGLSKLPSEFILRNFGEPDSAEKYSTSDFLSQCVAPNFPVPIEKTHTLAVIRKIVEDRRALPTTENLTLTIFGKSKFLDQIVQNLASFTENSLEFNLYLTEVLSQFMIFPDAKVEKYFLSKAKTITIGNQDMSFLDIVKSLRVQVDVYRESLRQQFKEATTTTTTTTSDTETNTNTEANPENGEFATHPILENILTQATQDIQHVKTYTPKKEIDYTKKVIPGDVEHLRKELVEVSSPSNNFTLKTLLEKYDRQGIQYQWTIALLVEVLKEIAGSVQTIHQLHI
eukprot:TRINITY_DN3357_c2_g1_i1.p1 TRINITY_DN3357_c2_g1~~TRINITY_DN3357_c2_g1_i1.p1  ORF type:complete len:650 (+),score=115.47 TRINITY_DN3357_c2_g1_i1:61-2010(+)